MHYSHDPVFRAEVSSSLQRLRRTHPNVTIVWRSTVPGHVNCSLLLSNVSVVSEPTNASQQPLPPRLLDEQSNEMRDADYSWQTKYNWDKIAQQSEIARELVTDPVSQCISTKLCHQSSHLTLSGVIALCRLTCCCALLSLFLCTVQSVGGLYLDVMGPTRLRHDSHLRPPGDCLHYCQPGPLDEWVNMLYNSLRAMQSQPS